MATQNAIDTNKPIEVSDGGTGATTLTDHSVLVGSGTSAITPLAVGATGELLVGVNASVPAFGTSATGDFTFTSSTADQTRVVTVINDDNTAASTSAARVDITTGGANVADPQIKYTITGQTAFSSVIDNSDSDKYKLSANAALGTTDVFVATTAGEITKPLQPAFLATLSTNQNNVTGNGTVYNYICDTEVFDQGGDYNTGTGQFTAPVTGKYFFSAINRLTDSTTAFFTTTRIISSNGTYASGWFNGGSADDLYSEATFLLDMDASDTCFPGVRAFGEGADTLDLVAVSGSDTNTCFSGYLVC